MKNFTLLICLVFVATMTFGQDNEATEIPPGPYMTFEEDAHDFGDITQGDRVEFVFNFENTGDSPLIITNIKVTCGCTATDWMRDPIPPGMKSSITVKFDSTGKLNKQNKVITIVSNASNPKPQIKIVANVLPKEGNSGNN